ncbi:MAG: Rrf2 family transcriptional regulator [Candidatus Moraniibacteriota bacterium]
MIFSTKAEYGLRAIVVLARSYPYLRSIVEISIEENISAKYLEQIFIKLKKAQLVLSQKGKSGGYTLSREPQMITVGEIVEVLEGKIEPTKCYSAECKNSACSSKKVWVKLSEEIKKTLDNIKLSDLIK